MQATNPRQAKRETYEQIAEQTEPLPRLINPDDVIDGATSWSDISKDRLDRETAESADVIIRENQHQETNELAFRLWRDSLTRAPMDHLTFDEPRDAVSRGYWPHSMDKWEVLDILYELGIENCPGGILQEARSVARLAIRDAMNPHRQTDASNV